MEMNMPDTAILIAIVLFSIDAALLLSVRTLLKLIAATLIVGLLAVACSRLANAATLLLVDHVAVHAPCTPLRWTVDRKLVCEGIIFRQGFE
jgi:hypothetical protein